jgi:hypothetical protein
MDVVTTIKRVTGVQELEQMENLAYAGWLKAKENIKMSENNTLKDLEGKDIVEIKLNTDNVKIVNFICGFHSVDEEAHPYRYTRYTFEKPLDELVGMGDDDVMSLFDDADVDDDDMTTADAEDKLSKLLEKYEIVKEICVTDVTSNLGEGFYIMSY